MTEIVGPPPWTSRQPTRPVEIAVALLLVLSFPLGLGAPHGVLPVASASPVVLHSAPDLGAAPSDAPARALAESPAVASPTWSPVGNLTTFPSPRAQPAMAYDSELGVVVLFGGCTNAGCFNDTWEYSNGTWTNVTSTAGHAPPARGASNLVDDPLDGYLVLWGGGSGSTLNDTWAFNGTGWHDLTRRGVPAPPPGYLASMAWDAADQYVLLSDNYSQGPTAGTWKFSGGNWTELTNTGPGSPGVTEAGGMDYDATVGAVVYYDDFPNTMNQDGTWEFSGGTWTDEGLVSTPVRAWPGMAYDGIDGYSLLFGGSRFVLPAPYQLNDTWAFEGTSWTNLTASSGAAPSARYGPGMAFDATDGYILLFGGEAYNGAYDTFPDDTWTFGIYSSSHPPAPTVAAGANRTVADAGLSIAFTATPGMYGNLPFTYAWNFGDGGTGTGISVDHVYGSAGVYPVSVTITDAHGLQGNASLTETVHSDPSATFLWSRASVDVGQLVYLNGSVANGTGPFQWNWSFGDGTYAAQSEATHAYAAPNGYEVQLVVTDALGVTATFRAAETVHAHPTVDFTASPTVTDVALAVNFSASAALGTPPYEYTWKFGDGQTVSLSVVAAAHTYSKPGNYPVNLTVVDQDGVTTWQEHTETVDPALAPTATVMALESGSSAGTSATANASTAFRFLIGFGGGTAPYAVSWNLGDGTTASTAEVNHTYARPGNYTAVAVVSDALGASYRTTLNVTVTVVPPSSQSNPPAPASSLFAGPLPYALVGAVAIAAIAAVLLWRRRKGNGPEETPEVSDATDPDAPSGPMAEDGLTGDPAT